MANSPRQASRAPGTGEREATIEKLLLTGLDSYFVGEYERAIHAWERVLFLDRGHDRAHAYIDRARRVVAERQRDCDARLQAGIEAFDRGEAASARDLLASVLRERAQDDLALTLMKRLEHLEAGRDLERVPPPARAAPNAQHAAPVRPSGVASRVLVISTCCFLLAAILVVLGWKELGRWSAPSAVPAAARRVPEPPLPEPQLSTVTINRARGLAARGHLHEALRALDTIRREDVRRPEADALRAELQRALLDAQTTSLPRFPDRVPIPRAERP